MAFHNSTDKDMLSIGTNLSTTIKNDLFKFECLTPPNEKEVIQMNGDQKEEQIKSPFMKRLYYCQRCLNHNEKVPRKGHKNFCRFAECECIKCSMVSKRRFLNSKLHKKLIDRQVITNSVPKTSLPKERVPTCALCAVHGCKILLRGHRKLDCPYYKCKCELCVIVNHRRDLMAKQIKLRRLQSNPQKIDKESRRLIEWTKLNDNFQKMGKFEFSNIPSYLELLSGLQENANNTNLANATIKLPETNSIPPKQNMFSLPEHKVNFNTSISSLEKSNTTSTSSNTLLSQSLYTPQQFNITDFDNILLDPFRRSIPLINTSICTLQQNQFEPLHFMNNVKNVYENNTMNNVMSNVFQSQIPSNALNFLSPVSEIAQQTMTPIFGNMPQLFSQPINIHNQGIQSNLNYLNYQNNPFLNNTLIDFRKIFIQPDIPKFDV